MKRNVSWFIAVLIVLTTVYLIDLNVNRHDNPANNIPWLKNNIIGIAAILILIAVQLLFTKKDKRK